MHVRTRRTRPSGLQPVRGLRRYRRVTDGDLLDVYPLRRGEVETLEAAARDAREDAARNPATAKYVLHWAESFARAAQIVRTGGDYRREKERA